MPEAVCIKKSDKDISPLHALATDGFLKWKKIRFKYIMLAAAGAPSNKNSLRMMVIKTAL